MVEMKIIVGLESLPVGQCATKCVGDTLTSLLMAGGYTKAQVHFEKPRGCRMLLAPIASRC